MSNSQTTQGLDLVERFKAFYRDVKNPQLDKIHTIYTDDIRFKDPIHQISGIDDVHAYLTSMCENVQSGRFEYLDQLVGENSAYIKWNMYFRHPKLGDETIVVRGITQIQFNEQIFYHEDSYDLGEMLYERIPVVGFLVRKIKQRLAAV